MIWGSGSHVGQEPHPGTGTHTLVQALGRLRELGHQQDYGGVTADPGGPPSRRVAEGPFQEPEVQLVWGRGVAWGGGLVQEGKARDVEM